jgi:ribosomal 30S subunit maturation factor RimM
VARCGPFISIGKIVGSHALKGDVFVNSYSRDVNTFKLSPFLFIGLKERCKVAHRPLKIKKHSPTQMLISLHGINNRDRLLFK